MESEYPISIRPFGAHAVLIEWEHLVSRAILNQCITLERELRNSFSGMWEFVPAYNSLTLIYNGTEAFQFETIASKIKYTYNSLEQVANRDNVLWTLPVCYDDEFSIDMENVIQRLGYNKSEIIKLHTESIYDVYGIGFLPGFMYLGGLPEVLEIPRRKHPRQKVAKGAVGLASKQTGIYPQESPGGWNIIGNCPVSLFEIEKEQPCFVSVGDRVQFKAIEKSEYDLIKIQVEVGIYKPEKQEGV
ncbi:5-oxoprolinase subunit PxpB [Flavobacterium sp. ASW18X]|uniref:5-oxoprolinase subunit PxpB n=1 Tax=Flavobacterium sp. ASW18X TaxID=2572595 RepID=UPI0010AE4BFD|nr:5-oxoprolinase subunit PxpB [Flavobacterium sp. ASW18X]TKD65934.1 5-oxoprolinase subunit PxpB [Flavobacterium sp. ASW18X]